MLPNLVCFFVRLRTILVSTCDPFWDQVGIGQPWKDRITSGPQPFVSGPETPGQIRAPHHFLSIFIFPLIFLWLNTTPAGILETLRDQNPTMFTLHLHIFSLTKLCLKGSYSIYKGGALWGAQSDSPILVVLIPPRSIC